jgi:hypothetical protein
MPTVISIPTPCHEDWNKMTAKYQGRHCDVCSKTVVDFTEWQPQKILLHFENNTNVCGRFRRDQLDEPIPTKEDFVKQISYFSIPFLKKVAAIFLFVFAILGSSFKSLAQGEAISSKQTIEKNNPNIIHGGSTSSPTPTFNPEIFKYKFSKLYFLKKKKKKNINRHKSHKKSVAKKNEEFPTFIGYSYSTPTK